MSAASNYTVDAEAVIQVNLAFNVPDGYKLAATYYRDTGLGTVSVTNEVFSKSGVSVFLHNIAGVKQSGKLTYSMLCLKSDLFE